MKSFFETPGYWFNLLSFVFGAAGVALGTWAFRLARVELRKTLDAAEAARRAADSTRGEIGRIVTVTDVQKLSAVCLEIMTLLESDQNARIARPLHQLRMGLAEFHATDHGQTLGRLFGSVELVTTIAELQRRFDNPNRQTVDVRAVRECIEVVKQIDQTLHQMVPGAAKI